MIEIVTGEITSKEMELSICLLDQELSKEFAELLRTHLNPAMPAIIRWMDVLDNELHLIIRKNRDATFLPTLEKIEAAVNAAYKLLTVFEDTTLITPPLNYSFGAV